MRITYTSPGTPQTMIADVQFPIYRVHYLDNCTIYTKVISPTLELNVEEIHKLDRPSRTFWRIEIDDANMEGCYSEADYLLGTGRYKLSGQQFERVYLQALKTIREA